MVTNITRTNEQTDNDIISLVLDGDVDLFSVLIDRYKKLVAKIVSSRIGSDNIDEVCNDIFFKAYKSLKSYNADAPFSHWLSVIATRSCKDFWRLHYARKEDSFTDFTDEFTRGIEDKISSGKTPEEILLEDEKSVLIRSAFSVLKPAELNVVTLLYTEDCSVADVAMKLKMTESNVKVVAFRARKKMASKLSKIMEEFYEN